MFTKTCSEYVILIAFPQVTIVARTCRSVTFVRTLSVVVYVI